MPSRPRVARRARALASFIAITALTVSGVAVAAPALAAGETLNVIIEQTDGTAAFDALDADATNGLIRTNDTVGYTISVQSNGGAQTAPTIVFDLPKGQQLVSMPNYCLDGSSVVPPTLGELTPPLTSTSWESYPVQTVTCVLADRGVDPVTIDYQFTGKVMAEVPSGTVMAPMDVTATSTATSDGATITDTSNEVQVTVVAEPGYDLSKNGTSSVDDNTGHVDIQTTTCTNPTYTAAGFTGCQTMRFPILVSVQAEGKGNTPLASDITFVDDISPDTLWGAGTTAEAGWNPAFAPSVVGCGIVTDLGNGAAFFPFGEVAGHQTTNSVTDSGSVTCAPGATGPVTVTISGADTSAQDYPTTNGAANVAMPGDKAYVVSGWILVEYPTAAINAIGQENPNGFGSYQLPYENTFSDLTATDIGGVIIDEANLENNVRGGTATVDLSGGFGKFFEGEPGNTANTGGSGYAASAYAGPPGSNVLRDGEGVVQAGGKVLSGINAGFVSPPGFGGVTQVICDAWDNTRIALTAAQWQGAQAGTTSPAAAAGTVGYMQANASNGAAVWLTGVNGPITPTYTVEYSNGVGGVATANSCNDETTGWFTDPALVPGNDAAQLVNGVYTGVSRVRITASLPKTDIAQDVRVDTAFSIGLTVLDTVVSGDLIGNWASVKAVVGTTPAAPTEAEVIASDGTYERLSNYAPDNHTGILGDRLKVQSVTARILKQVWDPSNNQYVSIGVPIYAAGVPVNYRLQPSLSAGVTTGATAATIVEDCLPAYQTFSSSTLEGGGAIVPELITTDANPVGATLDCAAGETYIRWNLGSPVINSVLPAILYTVDIAATAPNGVMTNTAMITAEGDTSTPASRTDIGQIQIQTPTGIKLSKTVVNPLIEVNPADATSPRPLIWNIQFAAIDTSNVTNVEIIDVLPTQGANGTAYTGTLAFESATSSSSAGNTRILYTSETAANVNLNPDDASNATTGSTVWCDAPSGGAIAYGSGTAADCPTAASAVTGLRIQKLGAFPANATVDASVQMIALGNSAGDVYNNRAQADATGVIQGVGPVQRAITVVASSIGDYVWNDTNSNGVQDAGEPAVAGVPVSVTGTDVDGNVITRTTTTDAAGNYLFDNLPSGSYVVTFDPAWVASHNFGFTLKGQGTDPQLESDADTTSGASDAIALGINEARTDIDAGLVQVYGGLVIVKDLAGAGASEAVGPFEFQVVCSYLGATVFDEAVTLERTADETTIESGRLGPIPVGASCVVTETATGGADTTPPAVTVLIVTNDADNTVTAGFVNEFSAGTIAVEKVLAGTDADSDAVKAKTFTIAVTCQVAVDGLDEPVTVFSGTVTLKGGQKSTATDANGDAILLPLGAVCFAAETDTGGADKSVVDHDTFENGVAVKSGTPDDLQSLLITATNTFDKELVPVTPKPGASTGSLPNTGANVTAGLAALLALILAGSIAVIISKRRRSTN